MSLIGEIICCIKSGDYNGAYDYLILCTESEDIIHKLYGYNVLGILCQLKRLPARVEAIPPDYYKVAIDLYESYESDHIEFELLKNGIIVYKTTDIELAASSANNLGMYYADNEDLENAKNIITME